MTNARHTHPRLADSSSHPTKLFDHLAAIAQCAGRPWTLVAGTPIAIFLMPQLGRIMLDARTTTRPRRPAHRRRFARGRRRTHVDSDRRHEWRAVAGLLPVSGCGLAPSVNILGSFFPAWLICIVVGIALTVVSIRVLVAMEIGAHLGPPALVYPSVAFIWIFATWLFVFGS